MYVNLESPEIQKDIGLCCEETCYTHAVQHVSTKETERAYPKHVLEGLHFFAISALKYGLPPDK